MKWTIKHINGNVLFEVEAETFLKAVEQKYADLSSANLSYANLSSADLSSANLSSASLSSANLSYANLSYANLSSANLSSANLSYADLSSANLRSANLSYANLSYANLSSANLSYADLSSANLKGTKCLVKIMGVIPGNLYFKRFNTGLKNNDYQFYVGLNTLRDGEVFASDERVTCSYPGFHFASKSWCAVNYADRPLEALIRLPLDAQINEPWATDGKASADKIEILQVWDTATGKDVTDKYRRQEEKKTKRGGKGK